MSIVDGGWQEPRPLDEVIEEAKAQWMKDSGYIAPPPLYVSPQSLPFWQQALSGMKFPELDQWGTPKEKLPDCPQCGEDELGVIHSKLVMCYACGFHLDKE